MTKLAFHPLLKQHPMMPLHEQDALGADIEKNGQILPIITLEGKIIDGRNRYLAMIARGLEPRVKELTKWAGKDFIASMNFYRKHLTSEERKHFAALISMESTEGHHSPTASNDAVTETEAAKLMGISRSSVQRAKAKLRGKKAKPRRKVDSEGVPVDKLDYPVPSEALPYWTRRQEILDLLHHISAARCALEKIPDGDPMYWYVKVQGLIRELNSPYNQLTGVLPAYVCWNCDGVKVDKCKVCKGTGVLSEFHWKSAPKEKVKERKNDTRPF